MSKYQEFDSKIFDITQIMLDCSRTEGQKSELLKISGEIDAAYREGSLSDAERRRLRADMGADGAKLPARPCGSWSARLFHYDLRGDLCRADWADHQRNQPSYCYLAMRRVHGTAVLLPVQDRLGQPVHIQCPLK